nr:hypothetical protein [uncultured Roseobacter sp.]
MLMPVMTGSGQELTVAAVNIAKTAFVAADRSIFERRIGIGPFFINQLITVNDARNVLIEPVSPPQIHGDEGITMAYGFYGPPAGSAANPFGAIKIRHGFEQAQTAFDLGEPIHNKLNGERVGTNFNTATKHLSDMPLVSQQKVLQAVHGLQQCPSRGKIAECDDTAKARLIYRPHIGANDPNETLRVPKDRRIHSVLVWIGERCEGPTPPRVGNAGALL